MSVFPVDPLRQAFKNLPKQPRKYDRDPIESRYFYAPSSHAKALHPDTMLVEGVHGVGKSEWWLQLSNPEHLKLIASVLPRAELVNTECSIGFGEQNPQSYCPSKEVLAKSLTSYDAQSIWNAIITVAILGYGDMALSNKISLYQKNLEQFEMDLRDIDNRLYEQNKKHIVLFDALDYAADDWKTLKKLLKGLLQAALKFRSFRAIRLKIFVRPDMLQDSSIYSFTGGSKIIGNKLTLEWNKLELFNLLWQYLGNDVDGGEAFRHGCKQSFQQNWTRHPDADVWLIPEAMRRDEALQKKVFHALVGDWMGDSPKSGQPYIWLTNHLEDGFGKVSPCSFLAALHEAADSDELTEEQDYPLNDKALKKGVQKGSQMQVRTLNEDYRWIEVLLKGKDLSFPCDFDDIKSVWFGIRSEIDDAINEPGSMRPPNYSDSDFYYEGIKEYLIALGIFQPMLDDKINMPEVYRVGYGLRRKGGVKPVK